MGVYSFAVSNKMKSLIQHRRKQEIYEACLEHANKYNLGAEFNTAYKFFHGDVLMALEDWDLLNDVIINKIDEINQQYEN